MLASANRVTRPSDFRATVRAGKRVGSDNVVLHVVVRGGGPSRFGFVVSKSVGGAVVRNRVKRRLRSICRELLSDIGPGADVVVRALPGCASSTWVSLHEEVSRGAKRAMKSR